LCENFLQKHPNRSPGEENGSQFHPLDGKNDSGLADQGEKPPNFPYAMPP
jgi:hypothetical protein